MSGCQKEEAGRKWGVTADGYGFLWSDENVLELDNDDGGTTL